MLIHASISEPPKLGLTFAERWESGDDGMLCCWLRGIEKAREAPELASRAKQGELPVLAWKGGVESSIKSKTKIGAMQYVATWQGLRGENLSIDLGSELQMTCNRTGVTVTYTSSVEKLRSAGGEG